MNMTEQIMRRGGAPLDVEFLKNVFDRLVDSVYWLNREGRVIYANEAACRSLECTCEEMLAYKVPDFDPNFSENSWLTHWQKVKALGSFTMQTLHLSKSGRIFPVEVSINYFVYGKNEFDCVIARDISARNHLEGSMSFAADIFRMSNEAIMVTDDNNHIVEVNQAFERITGYTLDELFGKNPSILQSEIHDLAFYLKMWHEIRSNGTWQGEVCGRRKNGEIFVTWITFSLIRHKDGSVFRHVAQFTDITEKKKREEEVWQHANFHSLTNLPNRRLFVDRLEQEIKKANRAEHQLTLLFIDLDEFKRINDQFGHEKGDRLLVEAARRIGLCVRETDTVAHIGGDEFTVILPKLGRSPDVARIAQAIVHELGGPFELGENTGFVSASVGIALYPADAQNVLGLLNCADRAMYEAKKNGRNCYAYFSDSANPDNAHSSYEKRRSIYLQREEP